MLSKHQVWNEMENYQVSSVVGESRQCDVRDNGLKFISKLLIIKLFLFLLNVVLDCSCGEWTYVNSLLAVDEELSRGRNERVI